jgi:hypothetical protein
MSCGTFQIAPADVRLYGIAGAGYLQRLLAVDRVGARGEVDPRPRRAGPAGRHPVVQVSIGVVRIVAIVEWPAHLHGDTAQRVDHLPEGLEIDRRVAIEGDYRQPAHCRFHEVTGTVLALEGGLQSAPEGCGVVADDEGRVDLLVVPAAILPGVDLDVQVSRH